MPDKFSPSRILIAESYVKNILTIKYIIVLKMIAGSLLECAAVFVIIDSEYIEYYTQRYSDKVQYFD